jgi:hypothetical protein
VTTIDIVDADVTSHVHVGGLGEVQGTVKWDGTLGAIPKGLRVAIEGDGALQGSEVDAKGNFKFERVLPGEYEFRLLGSAPNIVLRNIECGGIEISPNSPLQVGDRQKVAGCEITLAEAP